jgi:hypothetical protein
MTDSQAVRAVAYSELLPNYRSRLLWALCAIVLGVLIAGFWNYHLVDGFGKDFVAGQTIGDTERLSGSYDEQGVGFGFIFAIVAGLAATFTACNCVVFAMLPGLACSTEQTGSPRQFALKALGVFTLCVLLVCFLYGAYVGTLGTERVGAFNERPNRLAQAEITFTALGIILFVWGLISFGFLDGVIARLPKGLPRFFASPLTKAGLMGLLVGLFSVGRPFPVFRDFLAYAAASENPLYGGAVMALQGIGQILVMILLFLLLLLPFSRRIANWASRHPGRLEQFSAAALLAGGSYFIFYWGLARAYDLGGWGFKLNWYS